jgi:hypothetical protein
MPTGTLHIFELGTHKGKYGETIHEYQVNYTGAGNTFAGVMEEDKLKEFLVTKAVVGGTEVERTVAELHRTGRSTLEEIEIPQNEAGEIGLMQEPSDA